MSSNHTAYSLREEIANAVTHGIGMVLGIVGLVLLLLKSLEMDADALTITSMSIYGGSMIVLFLASTLYHVKVAVLLVLVLLQLSLSNQLL